MIEKKAMVLRDPMDILFELGYGPFNGAIGIWQRNRSFEHHFKICKV
jgi:hypothetical protein